jgi:radical SAM superfamily enzyme YgiQ (UPF0313 family)
MDRGFAVNLVDLNFELLSYLIKTDKETITLESLADVWQDRLREKIINFNPDIIGISCIFITNYGFMKEIAIFLKSLNKNLPVFVGGVAVTCEPEAVLKSCSQIDFVFLFEAEVAFCNLLDFINSKIDATNIGQLATLIDDEFISLRERSLPNLDEINTPAEYLNLPIGEYSSVGEIGAYNFWLPKGTRISSVLSNRGCRGHCSFCSVRHIYGMGVRSRDIMAVVDEIEYLKTKYNINHITWLDDDLFYNKQRAIGLFNEIIKRKLNITWDTSNGVIAAFVDDEIIEAATQSGCIGMHLGIESGNQLILRQINKPSTLDNFRQAAKVLKKYPQVFTKGFLIIGFPHETLGQIQDTINLAKEISLDWYILQILYPLPSTIIHLQMLQEGLIKEGGNISDTYNYSLGRIGRERLVESKEKTKAKDFLDLFNDDLNLVPTKKMLNDVWFITEYRINYERILNENSIVILKKWQKLLINISDRATAENPLSNLFLGIIENKLGNQKEAERRISLSKEFLCASEYWSNRFSVLGLDNLCISNYIKV